MSELSDHHRRVDRVLMSLDTTGLVKLGASPHVALAALHKIRYERKSIPTELRHISGAWLRRNGMGRLTAGELLPEGELP